MYHIYLLIFLFIHVLGDFYIQTNEVAEQKKECYKGVLQHSIMYLVTAFLCGIPFWSAELICGIMILGLSHFLIDSLKYLYMNIRKKKLFVKNINWWFIYRIK